MIKTQDLSNRVAGKELVCLFRLACSFRAFWLNALVGVYALEQLEVRIGTCNAEGWARFIEGGGKRSSPKERNSIVDNDSCLVVSYNVESR